MASQEKSIEEPQEKVIISNSVGSLLRASRMKLELDLRDVAETLNIRFIYLEAIEDGRYEDLPGAVYVVGFIRSYADYLGLDSEEVVRSYKNEETSQSGKTELIFPVPIPQSSIPGGAVMLIGVVVSLLVYVGWYTSTTKDGPLSGLVSDVPERLSEFNEKTNSLVELKSVEKNNTVNPNNRNGKKEEKSTEINQNKPTALPQSGSDQKKVVNKFVEESANDNSSVVSQKEPTKINKQETTESIVEDDQKNKPPVTEAVQTASADELAPKIKKEVMTQETGIIKPQINLDNAAASVQSANLIDDENSTSNENKIDNDSDGSRILVKALKNSWIQVRDNKAKKLLLTKLLRAGESYSVPNQPDLVLLTGNAGALEILVDGKSVPGLGPPGTIRKNVILDPEKLRQGEAIR